MGTAVIHWCTCI